MRDIMLDLETLGTAPGSVILSIGAVAFDPEREVLGPEYYSVINTPSCRHYGLTSNPKTVDWWNAQALAARQVVTEAETGGQELFAALYTFAEWLKAQDPCVRVWGNGADFDQPILAAAYAATGQETPWLFWNCRCYRTLKSLIPEPKMQRLGTYHNALDDAKSQALHAIKLIAALA